MRIQDPRTLVFPSYDGNGMFKSLGNNAHVGMLFIDFEKPKRLRVNGTASVHDEDPLLEEFTGAQVIVRVRPEAIFPDCPLYIHTMPLVELSTYTPLEGRTVPVPDWKRRPEFNEVLPPGDCASTGED